MVTVAEALAIAGDHYSNGRLDDCEHVCRQILQAVPQQAEALLWLGRAACRNRRGEEAAAILHQAVLADPNRPDGYDALDASLTALGREKEAAGWRHKAAVLADPASLVTAPCRLCGQPTGFAFFKTLLRRHLVHYAVCRGCGSLQSEPPYWLDEAYGITNVGLDTGMAMRTLELVIETVALFSLLRLDPQRDFIDYGGGNGLFTRMMRDRGFNFRSYDKYQAPFYSAPFVIDDFAAAAPAVVTAFEVFEHFVNPVDDVGALLAKRPEVLAFTTDTYGGQGADWHYLAAEGGQHIFFYTPAAFRQLAARHGAVFFDTGLIKLFVTPDFIAKAAAAGLDVAAAVAVARDRDRFIDHALRLFSGYQAQWQARWLATMTPPADT